MSRARRSRYDPAALAILEQFLGLDVRVGTIVAAARVPGARRPAFSLSIDFGERGVLPAAVEAEGREQPEALVGLQVAAVVNLPPQRLSGFVSEALVLALRDARGEPLLLMPERPVADGARVMFPEQA